MMSAENIFMSFWSRGIKVKTIINFYKEIKGNRESRRICQAICKEDTLENRIEQGRKLYGDDFIEEILAKTYQGKRK